MNYSYTYGSTDLPTGLDIIGPFFLLLYCLFITAILIFTAWLYWRIATKAGYEGCLGLLMFVPIVNLIVILIFALTKWPIEEEVERLRETHKKDV